MDAQIGHITRGISALTPIVADHYSLARGHGTRARPEPEQSLWSVGDSLPTLMRQTPVRHISPHADGGGGDRLR